MWDHGDAGPRGCGITGMPDHRDAGLQGYGDAGSQGCGAGRLPAATPSCCPESWVLAAGGAPLPSPGPGDNSAVPPGILSRGAVRVRAGKPKLPPGEVEREHRFVWNVGLRFASVLPNAGPVGWV